MPSRGSPYGISTRRKSHQYATLPTTDPVTPENGSSHSHRLCLQLQTVLLEHLSAIHCVVNDTSVTDLQYRLLGAKRYWYRSVKHIDKSGLKQWEARYYEVQLRRSTVEKLRRVVSWHHIKRLASDDVQLTSLGTFDTEKQAIQAIEAAVQVRDGTNPLRMGMAGDSRSSRNRLREPLSPALDTRFQVVVVSEAFVRLSQRQRLNLVYEILLNAFSTTSMLTSVNHSCLRGFSTVGDHVLSLRIWRHLPFHLTVVAKTPIQWKPSSSITRHALSDTERYGLSHLRHDRTLAMDPTVLPMSRGHLNLAMPSNTQNTNSKLPHFYHGLPDELKRMIAEEQDKANALLATSSRSTMLHKLSKNTEGVFLQKYQKRRREYDLAATRLQRLLRRNAHSKILRSIGARERASLCIQRVFRGHQERVYVTAYRAVVHSASTIIQAVFRSHRAREYTKQRRKTMIQAAQVIQRVYRGHVGRQFARWVRQKASSAIIIERVVRGFMARRRVTRIRLAKIKRTVLVPAAMTIQRMWRGYRDRCAVAKKRTIRHQLEVLNPAAVRIGRILRGFLARQTAAKFRLANQSSSIIQKYWRSHRYYNKWMDLMELRRRDRMASKIGALGRGYVARQFVQREKRRVYLHYVVVPAVLRIQRIFRGYMVRKQHDDMRDRVEAAITLQQMWRKRRQIHTIQTKLRGFRTALRHANATRIQYWYKCCKAKEHFAFLQAQQRAQHGRAALVIQCAWRSYCSRQQLMEFRLCSRIERKAQALTDWKDEREDIEFDIRDARADLKRTIKYKAKSLRRIKELKDMRLEWERRQPVVEKELSELTQEDIDRGWGEAFQTEKHILRFQLELSVEDILGRKDQIREYEEEIEDLRLELEDLERDLEECILDETMELEAYRDMEIQQADKMFVTEMKRKIRLQRVRWGVRNDRRNVIQRTRDDVKAVERELLAQRQVQELGVLGFERKLLLKEKIEDAVERVVREHAKESEVMLEMRRDAKVIAGFDKAIQRMDKITKEYTFEYRMPKHDFRELVDSPMCEGCGRISCDCDERENERTLSAEASHPRFSATLSIRNNVTTSTTKKTSRSFGTNYGHPLRRKRNYEQ